MKEHQGIVSTTYVGADDHLQGKACLCKNGPIPEQVLVQFNDLATGKGEGWHVMYRNDFDMWTVRV